MYSSKNKNNLNQNHIVIFGGSSPIGVNLIEDALEKNYIVSLVGRSKVKIKSKNFFFIKVDLSKKDLNFKKIFKDLNRKPITHMVFLQRSRNKKKTFENEINVSVRPVVNMINEFYKSNSKNKIKKSILLISSPVVGRSAMEQDLNYHLAKALIDQLVKYFSIHLGKINCNINALSPDLILKERAKNFYRKNKKLTKLLSNVTPMGRMATTSEISKIILNLIDSNMHYFNGEIFNLDGGIQSHNHISLAKLIGNNFISSKLKNFNF